MAFAVDIDTGGTFTDGLFADGKEIRRVTPHDLTVSWFSCIREGATKFGFSTLGEFHDQGHSNDRRFDDEARLIKHNLRRHKAEA